MHTRPINTGQPFLIEDLQSLTFLRDEIRLFKRRKKHLKVRLPNLSEEENLLLQKEIRKHYSACGCSQGRSSGFIAFGIYIVLLVSGILSLKELGIWNTILLYFIFSFVVMGIGKIYGLYYARRAITRLIDRLRAGDIVSI